MNKTVLVIGKGAREHALGWKLKQSPLVKHIFFAPGNAGTEKIGTNLLISDEDVQSLLSWAKQNKPDLTVVGPELPLTLGIVDEFLKNALPIVGPNKAAAKLESSKAWSFSFMKKYNIPSAKSNVFQDFNKASVYISHVNPQTIVIKADGLAAGKGVFLPENQKEAQEVLKNLMIKKTLKKAGEKILIQERLNGEELSFFCVSDGKTIVPFPTARDYKRLNENNTGPMTGGVGSFAPDHIPDTLHKSILADIVDPTISGMLKEGTPYTGVLYLGLMKTQNGPRVLEYNVRFGDPEAQVLLPLLSSDLFQLLFSCTNQTLSKQLVRFSEDATCGVVLSSKGYPENPQQGTQIFGLPKEKEKSITVFHAATKKENGSIVTSGGRVLTVVAISQTLEKARQTAYAAIGKDGIHFSNMQYRTDIGKTRSTEQSPGVYRIEVSSLIPDTKAGVLKKSLSEAGFKNIHSIKIKHVYTIAMTCSHDDIAAIADILHNNVTQTADIFYSKKNGFNKKATDPFSYAIEIGFLPGVTDNIAQTAKETIEDKLGKKMLPQEGVFSSTLFLISGSLHAKDTAAIARQLHNPLIQRTHIKSYQEFVQEGGMDCIVPTVHIHNAPDVTLVDLHIPDNKLEELGKKGIPDGENNHRGPLSLNLEYLKTIRSYFDEKKRPPTDVELESLAQTWSEHCKHTIFADPIDDISEGLFERYIKGATVKIRKAKKDKDFCASVFSDNSGSIEFDDEYLITDKVETHNSPSALDPFGGAITGIVGVNRDALGFGLGAKPILNRFGFCFGMPDDQVELYRDKEKKQPLLSPKRIMDGVVTGVNSGGNCSGIPTSQGFVYFDHSYKGKPLVFVGTLGLIPKTRNGKSLIEKGAHAGDHIVVVGGRVGLDGIHGATFSSEALSTGSPATAVQIGDPITQKKLSDVLIREARDKHLYTSITDNGAGGLSCSVAEMARESGGCHVQLDLVPLKYPGLKPWQVWISESQERMTLAVPPEKRKALLALCEKRGVEATVIGTFTDSGKCTVSYNNTVVMDVDMEFLHNGLPKIHRITKKPNQLPKTNGILEKKADLTTDFLSVLHHNNVASFESISMQYDHEVQGSSMLKPLTGKGRINADATAIQPVFSSKKAVVVSHALFPSYTELDPYNMAMATVDTAVRQLVAAGANPESIALLDNFCWCSSNDPKRLYELKEAVRGAHDAAVAYEAPFISGKDSMFNDFKGFDEKENALTISIEPTLLISSLSVVEDGNMLITSDFKSPGDNIYLLGETKEEFGGSVYTKIKNAHVGTVPKTNTTSCMQTYKAFNTCVQKGLISSAIAVTKGGLAAALGKCAMAGLLGGTIELDRLKDALSIHALLFSESTGRILVGVSQENSELFEKHTAHIPKTKIGTVRHDSLIKILHMGKPVVSTTVHDALSMYKKSFGVLQKQKPEALVLSGYGLNCEDETVHALKLAGAKARIVHINDVIDDTVSLQTGHILVIPGGFAFGDDTGSGNAYAWKLKNHLWEELMRFIKKDNLILGICNGFQILVQLGLLPALDGQYGTRQIALTSNANATYTARWVDLKVKSKSHFFRGISTFSLPIAHGEGKFYASDDTYKKLEEKNCIALEYTIGDICTHFDLDPNPNGSLFNVAAVTDETGKIMGMMPHPERAISFTHLPHWTYLKEQYKKHNQEIPANGPGLKMFQNVVSYFS